MLELHDINRSFGDRHVLRDVSFTVEPGRLTGFVGATVPARPPPCGSSSACSPPTAAAVTLAGDADRRQSTAAGSDTCRRSAASTRRCGCRADRLPGAAARDPPGARPTQRGAPARAPRPRRAPNDTVESLSLGNQQRAQIAAALVHEPDVLDPGRAVLGARSDRRRNRAAVLKECAAGGAPVLFSSHQLDVVERLCDDLVDHRGRRDPGERIPRELRAEHSRRRGSSWSPPPGPNGCRVGGGQVRRIRRRIRVQFDADSELDRPERAAAGDRAWGGDPVRALGTDPGADLPGGHPMSRDFQPPRLSESTWLVADAKSG